MHWLAAPFKWLLAAPARWLGRARGFGGVALPTRVAIILALFLSLCVVGYYVASAWLDDKAVFGPKLELRFVASWLLLLVAIPVAAYFAVHSWLETEPTMFPDIDEAWEKGLAAISRAGTPIDHAPLYLVLGIASAPDADNLMQAVDWDLLVNGEPDGRSPLRWYATKDAVLVFLLDACATSKLQQRAHEMVEQATVPTSGGGGIRGTLIGPAGEAGLYASSRPDTGIRGTILADDSPIANASLQPPAAGIRGTIMAGAGTIVADSGMLDSGRFMPAASANLDRREIVEQIDRLARVCTLAAQSRQPLCPINGSIAVLDWHALSDMPDGRLSTVLLEDVSRMIEATKLHSPLALLVNGLDDELGFIELVRRVGEGRARENRFGHGFNHQAALEVGQLSALVQHSCGAFEDWIYDLFRHPDALGRSNNDKLYVLLCKIRNQVQPKLIDVVSGLAGTIASPSQQRGPLLCGCYFGATGGSRMRQAFVRSVFDKVIELEEDLEWTEDAWIREFRFRNAVRGILLVNAILIAFILGLLIYYFFIKG